MLKVGLTGGVGSGKSSAVSHFQSLGVSVVDADLVARAVVASGGPALPEIVCEFGADAVNEQGELNRAWMREQVFSDATARERLEAITHPLIRQRLREEMEKLAETAYIIVDIPLLIEKGYQSDFDAIIVVDCDEAQQLNRVKSRDGSDDSLIRGIIKAQVTRAERLSFATHILDNSTTLERLYEQIDQLHRTLLRLAADG